jgi:NDP-hexose-3-ketoreductase
MIRIGIICPSEIATRRFLPSLIQLPDFEFVGISYASKHEWENANNEVINNEKNKAQHIINQYGGELFDSYKSMIESDKIDAIYLPLPPALHFKWAKLALVSGKHVMIEKPATISYNDTKELISIAGENKLVVHENYMFTFHSQLNAIDNIINNGTLGQVRLFRLSFGFPRRDAKDFRYNKKLGGGALLDCGGYTLKYASMLLGETARIVYANSNFTKDFNVDINGSAALINESGRTVQIGFGMDNAYKCDLEVWGSKAHLSSGRVLTAPEDFVPEVLIKIGNEIETIKLPSDNAFKKSIIRFQKCVENHTVREENYNEILKQAKLVNEFLEKTKDTYYGK